MGTKQYFSIRPQYFYWMEETVDEMCAQGQDRTGGEGAADQQ